MRINKFLAQAAGLSRRSADRAILEGRVAINQQLASLGDSVDGNDTVTLDSQPVAPTVQIATVMLNKPTGYVCSRAGQGSRTIYSLLPPLYHGLKPIGRLDKDSSGLLLLTNDGGLANRLAHPRYTKQKIYQVIIDKPLTTQDEAKISQGIQVDDYTSRLELSAIDNKTPETAGRAWRVTMSQGRNRQIRRTFAALGYTVKTLHRVQFGDYKLASLPEGQHKELPAEDT